MKGLALGAIDNQRGFMPAAEGERLHLPGFGELPVADGHKVVPLVNALVAGYVMQGLVTFTTQDWHPRDTAHFSDRPNFTTTWPVHCVGGTPGAELHPGLIVPKSTLRFHKGMEVLLRGEDDNSYSGISGRSEQGESLGAALRRHNTRAVAICGLALDYCAGRTAVDIRTELDIDVVVALDATRAISEDSANQMLEQFEAVGVRTATTRQILAELEAA